MCGICGPWFGLAQAFISSLLRMVFGTGSFFAFPGSMVGVLLASGFTIIASIFLWQQSVKL